MNPKAVKSVLKAGIFLLSVSMWAQDADFIP
jgi:hypothetical protein